ncbi:hypothetical protein PK35_14000 [Tamlana nanhaiensis]|uniref:DoxX family protein n=1 Tax=Neotamlana nanhaiensis TaxID=1382798 RepID=A0A0D7VXE5_9FLAO|nr:DoxX-like family protein [Tamlana nanhaiensis]KJD31521.1 hypothetical protein PK35_14000 [Tamlana nanhaiensis]
MTKKIINLIIAAIWLANGLYCKILNFVPRHELIIAEILNTNYPEYFRIIIGILEVGMSIWVISEKHKNLILYTQITTIAIMNILEFYYTPNLLLWGKFNVVFAAILIAIIYSNHIKNNTTTYEFT